jgi:histidinol dehydrogenase
MLTTQTSAVALDLLENAENAVTPKAMLTTQTSAVALDLLENSIGRKQNIKPRRCHPDAA